MRAAVDGARAQEGAADSEEDEDELDDLLAEDDSDDENGDEDGADEAGVIDLDKFFREEKQLASAQQQRPARSRRR